MNIENKPDIEPASKKRPILVWLISFFYVFSAAWTIISFTLIYSGVIPLNEAQKAYFDSQTIFDKLFTLSIGSLNVLGGIFLFLLRRYAYHCFIAAFSLGIIMTGYHIIFKNWLGAIGGIGLVSAVVGWIISIAIILYANNLIKKEILK